MTVPFGVDQDIVAILITAYVNADIAAMPDAIDPVAGAVSLLTLPLVGEDLAGDLQTRAIASNERRMSSYYLLLGA